MQPPHSALDTSINQTLDERLQWALFPVLCFCSLLTIGERGGGRRRNGCRGFSRVLSHQDAISLARLPVGWCCRRGKLL